MLKKITKYNYKTMAPKALLALFGTGLFASCSNDKPSITETETHTEDVKFGPKTIVAVAEVKDLAEDPTVSGINVVSDGESYEGDDISNVRNTVAPVINAAGDKFAGGSGIIKDVIVDNAGDSVYLADQGYTIQTFPQHNTTYMWGKMDAPTTEQVKASADSIGVKNVILKSDNQALSEAPSNMIIENLLEEKFAVSDKVKGEGNLNNVKIMSEADSLKLVKWGYTVNQR